MTETKTCPRCGKGKPRRHFRIYDKPVRDCRACRDKSRRRKLYRVKKRDERFMAEVRERARLIQAGLDAKSLAERKAKEKWIRSRFLAVTRVSKQRLREMTMNQNPTPKTRNAIAMRQDLLRRYEAAYAEQLALLASGGNPSDIVDLVNGAGGEPSAGDADAD